MKNILLILGAASIMAFTLNAQDNDTREKMSFGFKIGANFSNVYDTKGDNFETDSKMGLATGAFLGIPIGKYLGFQPELLYSQKGYISNSSLLGYDYKLTHTSTFLDIPLLIQLKPIESFTIVVGPQYSFLMNQKDKFESEYLNVIDEEDFENNNIHKNTFCFLGGFDIDVNNIVLGIRAGWDITNNNGDGTSTNPQYKNVWYQATIGYKVSF